jgi:FtsH-binding integral membrane protein
MVVSYTGDWRQSMTGDFNRLLIAWLAVLVVVLGTAVPLSIFCWFSRRAGEDDLAWQEGYGFFIWVACLIPFVLCQAGALVLARQSWGLFPAKAAGFGAIGLLALTVIFHLWALWGQVTWGLLGVLVGGLLGFYGSALGRYGFIRWSERVTDTSYRFDILLYGFVGAAIGSAVGALLAVKLTRRR